MLAPQILLQGDITVFSLARQKDPLESVCVNAARVELPGARDCRKQAVFATRRLSLRYHVAKGDSHKLMVGDIHRAYLGTYTLSL